VPHPSIQTITETTQNRHQDHSCCVLGYLIGCVDDKSKATLLTLYSAYRKNWATCIHLLTAANVIGLK